MWRSRVTQIRSSATQRSPSVSTVGLHHPFGAADVGDGVRAVPGRPVEQVGDDADPPDHSGPARSTVRATSRSRPAAPSVELVAEELVVPGPGTVVEPDGAEPLALGEDRVDERAERREPDPAGDDRDVVAVGGLDRPAAAHRAAQPELVARGRGG